MAKPLKDILAGVKKSQVVPGSIGKDPGVDYMPKAKAEQDFVAQHSTEKHEDRVGNGDDVYKGNTKYVLDSPKEAKHGHRKTKDSAVYDKIKEDTDLEEEKHFFHVHMPAIDTRGHKMVDDKTSEPMGQKPKGHRLKITVPGDRRTATNKAAKYVAKNYGTDVKFTYGGKVSESLAVPLVGSADGDESAEMAKTELRALANKAMHLVASVPDSMVIEPWVQSKIAKAKEMISSVHDYMVYGDHDEQEQTAPYDGGIDMSSGTVRNTLPNFSADVNTGRNV